MSSVPSWIWPAAGWVLLVCGAYLLLLGRVRLTKRRGRLCRGCGYDMAGLESLQCPECGRVARSERELQRRPPRLVLRGFGLLLLLASPAAPRTPEIVKHGWAAAIPDWPLAVIAPREDPWTGWLATPGAYAQPTPVVGTAYERLSRALLVEVGRRLDDGSMLNGAAQHYLRRVHAEALSYVDTNLRTPAFWARGAGSVPAWFSILPAQGGYGLGGFSVVTAAVTRVDESANRVEVELLASRRARSYSLVTVTRPMDFSYDAAALMEHVQSPELDAAVGAAVRPTVVFRAGGECDLVVHGTADTRLLPCFSVYTCELLLNGKPLVSKWFNLLPSGGATDFSDRLRLTPEQAAALRSSPDAVEVVLRGLPDMTVSLFRLEWRSDGSGARPKAWSGVVRVKPAVERSARPGNTAKPPTQLVEPSL